MAKVRPLEVEKWLAKNKAKRWTELFFFFYSFTWITWCLCILVPLKLYDSLDEWGYLALGVFAAAPCFLLPIYFQDKSDAKKPITQRYWVKANIWIAIFSFVGNYLWTHYFYSLLGASYSFPAHRLNEVCLCRHCAIPFQNHSDLIPILKALLQVPITLYFMTHAYFCFYHSISNLLIRRVRTAFKHFGKKVEYLSEALLVFLLSYITAYGETLTISHFPYYDFLDREKMYSVGSLFYAMYFFVSFPLFFRMDEEVQTSKHFSLWRVVIDSLGAAMLVTLLLDFWRIAFGGIVVPNNNTQHSLPWAH
jgi:cycloeucalenol cycloisomerase